MWKSCDTAERREIRIGENTRAYNCEENEHVRGAQQVPFFGSGLLRPSLAAARYRSCDWLLVAAAWVEPPEYT